MSSKPFLSWADVKFTLQNDKGEPVDINEVLPYPNSSQAPSPADQSAIKGLCTLPPTDLARRTPPSFIEHDDGCTPKSLSHSTSRTGPGRQSCIQSGSAAGDSLDAQCIWNALTQDPSDIDLQVSRTYCLPLDDPTLLANPRLGGLVPVPIFNNTSSQTPAFTDLRNNYRLVPALKQYLDSRNHSAANLPDFANVTVRPMHKRLRLGICVPLPPVGSPCSFSAIDSSTGTIANDWTFPGGRLWTSFDIALARPHSSLSSMVGPAVNTVDQAATTQAFPPPFPFFRYPVPRINYDGARSKGPFKSWAIPLVACAPSSTNNTTLGTIRPLVVNGTCSSHGECMSGVCSPASKACDNSIKPETNSPFSPTFTSLVTPPRAVEYPASNVAVRQVLDWYSPGYHPGKSPEWYAYYWPALIAGAIAFAALLVTCIWTVCVRRAVRRWTGEWRTTTERDVELKPVSGRMVADLGDEAAVEEAVAAAREPLPVYVQQS